MSEVIVCTIVKFKLSILILDEVGEFQYEIITEMFKMKSKSTIVTKGSRQKSNDPR